jgi:hypothetical protein
MAERIGRWARSDLSCWFGASVCTLDCTPPVKSPADSITGGCDGSRRCVRLAVPGPDAGAEPMPVPLAANRPARLGKAAAPGQWPTETSFRSNR